MSATFALTHFTHGNEYLMRRLMSWQLKLLFFTLTTSGTYSSGGWDCVFDTYLPTEVLRVFCEGTGGYSFEYDVANKKLKAFTSGGTEASGTVALTIKGMAIGR